MHMCDVKPMHCKIILNRMEATYTGSTICQTYITMGTLFKAAKMNDLIYKHPKDGVRYTKPVRAADDIHFLTREEQQKFLEAVRRSRNYNQYALILETGLRTGEMIGRYVHVTSESLDQAVRLFESNRVSDIKVHAEMA